VVDYGPIFWFFPFRMNSFSKPPDTPRLLNKKPDGIGHVVVDMANDVDKNDEKFEEGIEEPTVGHITAGDGPHDGKKI